MADTHHEQAAGQTWLRGAREAGLAWSYAEQTHGTDSREAEEAREVYLRLCREESAASTAAYLAEPEATRRTSEVDRPPMSMGTPAVLPAGNEPTENTIELAAAVSDARERHRRLEQAATQVIGSRDRLSERKAELDTQIEGHSALLSQALSEDRRHDVDRHRAEVNSLEAERRDVERLLGQAETAADTAQKQVRENARALAAVMDRVGGHDAGTRPSSEPKPVRRKAKTGNVRAKVVDLVKLLITAVVVCGVLFGICVVIVVNHHPGNQSKTQAEQIDICADQNAGQDPVLIYAELKPAFPDLTVDHVESVWQNCTFSFSSTP